MAPKKATSKSSVKSDGYTGFVIGGIIIRENPLFNNSTSAFDLLEQESNLKAVSVMMENVTAEATACGIAESNKTPTTKVDDKGKVVLQETKHNSLSLSPPC
ncbi:ty3-gypsy retrotransposon protein [Cucumis melo var. makuwa]|uniref:Ty3-gypsy retrotransposon protein n=1 Tax=Cucumis melo var. makuwa TaxID=1194695 RepID=A0A5D3CCP0_CUCMM|nr:ty3-gypsy retrotransposon protein [Cucumis melo var. makuwa]TYK09623.1 ty3-gypsy retrotransposon protein [Cucumis melo var. makuwa]